MTCSCKQCGTTLRPKLSKLGTVLGGWAWTAFIASVDPQRLGPTRAHMSIASTNAGEYLYCGGCRRDVKIGEMFG